MMKVTLLNFRCHDNAVFEIDPSRFTLIAGKSGVGKSSILMALDFAFRNEGRKLIKRGCKWCQVIVDDVVDGEISRISRRKNPCRLLVKTVDGKEYEDTAAQSVLDRHLKWDVGYVKQQYYKSFIFMSPADKLSYIRELSLNKEYVAKLIGRCKNLCADRKTRYEKLVSEKGALKDILVDDGISSSLVVDDDDERRLYERYRQLVDARKSRDDKLRQREYISRELEEIVIPDDELPFDDYDSIGRRIERLKKLKDARAIRALLAEIDLPESVITTGGGGGGENGYELDRNRYVELSKMFNANLHQENRLYRRITCPSCRCRLKYDLNVQVEIDDDDASCCTSSSSVDEIKRMNELIDDNNRVGKEMTELDSKYGPSILSDRKTFALYKRYDELNRRLKLLLCDDSSSDFTDDDDDDTSIDRLKELQRDMVIRRERINRRDALRQQLDLIIVNVDDDDGSIDAEINDVESKLELCKHYKRVVKYRRVVENLCASEKKLHDASRLKSLIAKAESISVTSTINLINRIVNYHYVREFFDDDSFRVLLELRDDKLTLNIYDGDDENVDLQFLSGGESVRIIVAFTAALCEINDVKCLYLDEILSPLDEESASSILSFLKRRFDGIVCVSHQATRGMFDNIIDL